MDGYCLAATFDAVAGALVGCSRVLAGTRIDQHESDRTSARTLASLV